MRLTLRLLAPLLAVALLYNFAPAARAQVTYLVDDGTIEAAAETSPGFDLTWANQFTTVAGGTTITNILIAWGRVPAGRPFTATLWSDPNNDGSPADAVLLSSAPGVVISGNAGPTFSNIFDSYAIPAVTLPVGANFFAAVTMRHADNDAPAGFDVDAPGNQKTWVNDQATLTTAVPIRGFDATVRAVGVADVAAVPEPGSLAMLAGVGVGGLLLFRRKIAKR
jgi:hypothetical protein